MFGEHGTLAVGQLSPHLGQTDLHPSPEKARILHHSPASGQEGNGMAASELFLPRSTGCAF